MAGELARGGLRKMRTALDNPVSYRFTLDDEPRVDLNPLLGQTLVLRYLGEIHCVHCGRLTKKSFNQGFCYPCFRRLAQCDSCIVSPEKCHFHLGTCREPAWGEQHCMIEHIVYLANTSGVKVGITRHSQVPTRWMDQGASQALPVIRVDSRYQSGLVEMVLKAHVADRTQWQAMLRGPSPEVDLADRRDRLLAECAEEITALQREHGLQAIQPIVEAPEIRLDYPVLEYPTKVKSFNLDREPLVEGTLMGIKGQYLIFDTGVINLRKYGGYQVALAQP